MSKIFRLHKDASETIEHWQQTASHLSDNYINKIEDPSGSNAQTQITSIPSPFARMDLVRTAFRYVNSKKEPDGTTIYHRMVSDCLDIGEIFFNIEALSDKVELLEWNSGIIVNGGELDIDANSELGKLLGSPNPKHRLLGETLKMYLFQDKKSFNFEQFTNCYLLNYKQGPEISNIIGGTSPATLFFSSANDLSYVDITFSNDQVFDDKYCPLHKRRADFILFIYAFQESFKMAVKNKDGEEEIRGFSETFPDFFDYMRLCYGKMDSKITEEIKKVSAKNYDSDYNTISVNAAGNFAQILSKQLRTKKHGKPPGPDENDFVIDATRVLTGMVPCVLPNEKFSEQLKYAGGTWQSNYHEKVPFYDDRPLNERTLPNQPQIKYPYLTVSDFLEPYLVKLPFPIDKEKFFDGNYKIAGSEEPDHSYVLPVKKEFFTYFTTDDLQGVVADGKKRFEMYQLPGGVKVIIRISIKNNHYIEFSRSYSLNQFQDKIQKADEKTNAGIISENQFTLAIYPFIKLTPDINPHYRVLLVDRDVQPLTKQNNYTLQFYEASDVTTALSVPSPKIRSSKQQAQGVTTAYHIVEKSFDIIGIRNSLGTGLLVPLFKPMSTTGKIFKFAIDFGTTNTHIEYKTITEESRPFDITEKDVQLGTLHNRDEEAVKRSFALIMSKSGDFALIKLLDIIREEFIPFIISKNTQYKFPQRTIIDDNNAFNPDETTYALADFNIPFWYLKEDPSENNFITPNLKWNDFKNKRLERRTKGFLKQLFLMIRNKVLLNGGELSSTEIVWFFPSSMPKFRRDFLEKSWNAYYERYISDIRLGNVSKINKMSESFAPFYYYYHKENVRPHDRPAVSIDIGGGTTDVVIYQSDIPVLLTSFRFAGNSVFEDPYGNSSAYNGFVQRYEGKIKEALSNTTAQRLISVYDNLKQKNSSSVELIEFFFSLEDNNLIKTNKLPLSFSKMLSEDYEMKMVFMLFYASVIYHIAGIMRAKDLPVPEYITFSGNGSKLLKLIDSSADMRTLLAYTKIIFEDVYQTNGAPLIEFRFSANPKEITCKGGLECSEFKRFEELEERIQTAMVGDGTNTLVPHATLRNNQINDPAIVEAVYIEAAKFIDKFFAWHNKFSYYQNFGISPKNFQLYKELINSKIKNDLLSGIKEKQMETDNEKEVNIKETLFFYPLVGALNRLAYKIYNDNK